MGKNLESMGGEHNIPDIPSYPNCSKCFPFSIKKMEYCLRSTKSLAN